MAKQLKAVRKIVSILMILSLFVSWIPSVSFAETDSSLIQGAELEGVQTESVQIDMEGTQAENTQTESSQIDTTENKSTESEAVLTESVTTDSNQNDTQQESYIILFEDEDKVDKTLVTEFNGEINEEYENVPAIAVTLPESALEEIQNNPDVKAVEKDIKISLKAQTADWGIARTKASAAWNSNFTGKGVKIAVIDSGISQHEDLVISGGVSYVPYTSSYHDDNGHGTHVAGIIGARNNSIGTVGIAPDSSIYAVKVLDQNGDGNLSDIIKGIEWSINNKMDIINLSLGTNDFSQSLQDIVNKAYSQNILVVAAAGNDGDAAGSGDTVDYPARYTSAIAVAATTSADKRASFSATGSTIEVSAPGENILSTYLNNEYAYMDGTSMAAPYVAGNLALIKQANSSLSASELRLKLQQSVEDLGAAGKDSWFGYGLIQAPVPVYSSFPTYTQTGGEVHYNWGNGAPSGMPVDNFKATFDQSKVFDSGDYFIQAIADDGVKVEVDGQNKIDRFSHYTGLEDRALWLGVTAGQHTVKTHYLEYVYGAGVFSDIVKFDSWVAYYYPNKTLSGFPTNAKVIAPTGELKKLVENNGDGSPITGIPNDNFSAKYTTVKRLPAGEYILQTKADDGVRVYIDGKLVLDRWQQGAYAGEAMKVTISDRNVANSNERNVHWIEVQYREDVYGSSIDFFIEPYNTAINNGWLGEFFPNKTLQGTPVVVGGGNGYTRIQNINFNWGGGSPHVSIPADNFSARLTKNEYFTAGNYIFETTSDDGVRVYVDGNKVLDAWQDGIRSSSAIVPLTEGNHIIRVEYYEYAGPAQLSFSYKPFQTTTIVGETVRFNWGNGSPSGLPSDYFTAIFDQSKIYDSGDYFIQAIADDGVRVEVDGQFKIDRFNHYTGLEDRALWLGVTSGQHSVKTHYLEYVYGAGVFSDIVKFDSWLAYYYPNKTLSGFPTNAKVILPTGEQKKLIENNGNGSPISGIPNDNFSAKYTTAKRLPAGDYILGTKADDGVRVYIDGKLVLDRWQQGAYSGETMKVSIADRNVSNANEKDVHWIEVQYREDVVGSYIDFFIEPYNASYDNTWLGEYFPNKTLQGTPVIVGGKGGYNSISSLSYNWGSGSPHASIPADNYSARFTKTQHFSAGNYIFETTADDGVRVFVDGNKVIDLWQDGVHSSSSVVALTEGNHNIRVEYYEYAGPAQLSFNYKPFQTTTITGETVRYNWGNGSPAGMPSDYFTVTFDQSKIYESGDYFIQAIADDGVKVQVDGQLKIDRYSHYSGSEDRALWLGVTAGQHTVKTHYLEYVYGAGVYSDIAKFDSWVAYYYPNKTLSGFPANAKVIAPNGDLKKLIEDNGNGSPVSGIPSDNFSAKYTTAKRLQAGEYILRTKADDGVRVYIDGKLVLDRWQQGAYSGEAIKVSVADRNVPNVNEKNVHWIEVQYREDVYGSAIEFFMEPYSTALDNTWLAEYAPTNNVDGTSIVFGGKNAWNKINGLDFNWGYASPHSAIPNENFNGRFTKSVYLEAGTYVFEAKADDKVQVLLNDKIVLDSKNGVFGKLHKESVYIPSGEYKIVVDYTEVANAALLQFDYKKVSDQKIFYQYNKDINYNWGLGSPNSELPSDNFAALFEKSVSLEAGNYFIQSFADDGVRVEVDGNIVTDRLTAYTGSVDRKLWLNVPKGEHTIKTHYVEQSFEAGIFSDVIPFGSWVAYYYPTKQYTGLPVRSKVITPSGELKQLNDAHGFGSPGVGVPTDNFAAKYTTVDRYPAGSYVLKTKADDGIRVYVDGKLVLDRWNGGYEENSIILKISDNSIAALNEKDIHWIDIEYREDTYDSYIQFSLQSLEKYESIYLSTQYNLTLSEMLSKQMAVLPQTDKNYPVYIREDALSSVDLTAKIGTVTSGPWNVREGLSTDHRILGKVSGTVEKPVQLKILSSEIGADGYTWYRIERQWKNASESDTLYYLNPANFTPDTASYMQFLVLSQSAGLNETEVNQNILSGKGTLAGKAKSFIDAGSKYNVNEIYLISHSLLETGNGTSRLAKGALVKVENGVPVAWMKNATEVMTVNDVTQIPAGVSVVYNMYGINALDSCADKCGAEYAYSKGWFTPEAAISGGAEFIASGYISKGQDTLYKMRWNPANPATHQYASDIGWAVKQTSKIYSLYNSLASYRLIFDVPKYK